MNGQMTKEQPPCQPTYAGYTKNMVSMVRVQKSHPQHILVSGGLSKILKCTCLVLSTNQNLVLVYSTQCKQIPYDIFSKTLPALQLGEFLYFLEIQMSTILAFSTASAISCNIEPPMWSMSIHTCGRDRIFIGYWFVQQYMHTFWTLITWDFRRRKNGCVHVSTNTITFLLYAQAFSIMYHSCARQ